MTQLPEPNPTHPAENFLILIADDDDDDILLLTRALQQEGMHYSIEVVRDGVQALDYLKGNGAYKDRVRYPFPSLFITDMKMPHTAGMEVLEWLKQHPECGVIPIIVFSSSNAPDDVKQAYALGANCYLVKPVMFDELKDLMQLTMAFWARCETPKVAGPC